MDRVRLAIVGCGNISQLNAPGYLQHPRCDVVVLCDTEPERAKRRAREWGISPRVYSDLTQVLDDGAVDAVELLTPTWLHADQIVAARGAHAVRQSYSVIVTRGSPALSNGRPAPVDNPALASAAYRSPDHPAGDPRRAGGAPQLAVRSDIST